MDTRRNQPRHGACNNYRWDGWSAGRKLLSGTTVSVPGVSKTVPPNNNTVDAYRRCSNCQKHFNYHGKQDNTYRRQVNPLK